MQVTEEESSNWRKLSNLVQALKNIIIDCGLRDCEIFIFTDNTTAEGAFWKGTAKSPKLFELVLEIKMLELAYGLIIHVVHVSGKRMIRQGTDALSRGNHSQGVMAGEPMQSFIPLHLSAIDREPLVQPWIHEITARLNIDILNPAGWFNDTHAKENFVWVPPLAAAEVVVEQLARARHKRPECLHIIVFP
jgi:hypothetical protein